MTPDKRVEEIIPVSYSELTPTKRRETRERYIQSQGNKCYWCKKDLSSPPPKKITDKKIDWRRFPENFLKYPIHLHHDHDTDMTEGAVHAYCNAVMWQYEGR